MDTEWSLFSTNSYLVSSCTRILHIQMWLLLLFFWSSNSITSYICCTNQNILLSTSVFQDFLSFFYCFFFSFYYNFFWELNRWLPCLWSPYLLHVTFHHHKPELSSVTYNTHITFGCTNSWSSWSMSSTSIEQAMVLKIITVKLHMHWIWVNFILMHS